MLCFASSTESAVRALAWVGGSVSTLAGAWVTSKIHGYQENRKTHLEDIKQKVLVPLSTALTDQFKPLVSHHNPAVVEEWGTRNRREAADVTEHRIDDGPLLLIAAPNPNTGIDEALYLDAKKNHFPRVIEKVETFAHAWRSHATECHAWVARMADEILSKSGLQAFPVQQYGTPYVDHYKLALFIYRRLFPSTEHTLLVHVRNPPNQWVIEGFLGTSAEGSEEQLKALISLLNELVAREKPTADRLWLNSQNLAQGLSALLSEINYAIASRRLRKNCDLVPFV